MGKNIQGPLSDLKVQELNCESKVKKMVVRGLVPENFLRPHPLEHWKMPFRENQQPSYCQFTVEKESVLFQLDCICILEADDNNYK